MSIYINSIKSAIMIFVVVAVPVMVPTMIFQYRKYGSISTQRSLILYAFLFYIIAAYCLVILPLPNKESVSASYQDMIQLMPFNFIGDFMKKTSLVISQPNTYLRAITEGVVIQPLFNIILTIPFGMFLKYYFNKSTSQIILYTFLLSLFFELTQLSGLYFVYPGPYRLFDIDDLMLNTLGGFVGNYITPLIGVFFPSRSELDRLSYIRGQEVSYSRRFIGYLIDTTVLSIISFLIEISLTLLNVKITSIVISFVVFMIYFAVLPVISKKPTLGQRTVKIKVGYEKQKRWNSMILRSLLLFVTINLSTLVFNPLWGLINKNDSLVLVGSIFLLSLEFLWFILLFIHVLYSSRKGHHLFIDVLSKTHVDSTI